MADYVVTFETSDVSGTVNLRDVEEGLSDDEVVELARDKLRGPTPAPEDADAAVLTVR